MRYHQLIFAGCILSYSLCTQAHLGGNMESVYADRIALFARSKPQVASINSVANDYHMVESTLSTGTVIKQYVSGSNVVFAVTWSGPTKPNLKQLLHKNFDAFVNREKAKGIISRSVTNQQNSDLVVQASGRMGYFSGRAYLPQQLPSNMSLEEIQ